MCVQRKTQPVSEAVEFADIWSLSLFPHVGGSSNSRLVSLCVKVICISFNNSCFMFVQTAVPVAL